MANPTLTSSLTPEQQQLLAAETELAAAQIAELHQQVVHAEYVGSGRLTSVSCPMPVPSLDRGAVFTCDGVLPDGREKLVWVSIDTTDGAFSSALSLK